jgi:Protein of unknown function (DUF2917)
MNAIIKSFRECVETSLKLQANQVVTIRRAQGACLQCVRGSVWVTLENDPLDFVLSPGERVCINAPGRMVIEGLEPSEIALHHRQKRAYFSQFYARAVACLGAVVRGLVSSHRCPTRTAFEKVSSYHGSFRL